MKLGEEEAAHARLVDVATRFEEGAEAARADFQFVKVQLGEVGQLI